MNKQILLIGVISSSASFYANAAANGLDVKLEAKVNFRNSYENQYDINFPLTSPGHETVEAGKHVEISNITLYTKWQMAENWQAMIKIDAIDLYERNPTSSDKKMDIDNLYIRYGTKYSNGLLPETVDFYAQVGKFGKFERQEDRHLESYGLVSTAFNRLEDSGIELGMDLPIGLYAKLSYTTGNPLFFRDPNALAGDNGVFKDHISFEPGDKDIKNGMPILYDAEIESFNLSKNPEAGAGLGYRWINNTGNSRVNVLAYGYQRDMAKTIELNGTFYGGDLDILTLTAAEVGLADTSTLPVSGKTKKEHGINLWWYQDNFAAFIQYVYQDAAGIKRDGAEVELSYAFTNIPNIIALTPVVRYSQLKSHYTINPADIAKYPAPSVTWDWKKYDIGVNLDVVKYLRLTLEYAVNDFIREGKHEDNNELLMTMRWSVSF